MKKLQFDLNTSFFHPLFSIFIPFFFLITYDRILNNLISFDIPFYLVLTIITAGIVESIFGNLFEKKFYDYLARLREAVLIVIIFSVFYILILHGKTIQALYLVFLALFQWLLSFNIHKNFRSREILFNDVNKNKGKNLTDVLRKSQFISQESHFDLTTVKNIIIYFQLIIFFLVVIYFLSNIQLKISTVIAITVNSIFSFISVSVMNTYIDEQKMLFKGFLFDKKTKNEKLSFVFLFLFFSLTITVLLSCYLKLFDYSDLVYLLSLLSGLFPAYHRKKIPLFDKMENSQNNRMEQIDSFNKFVDKTMLLKILIYIIAVLFFTAIAFMIFLLIAFIFKPFFKKYILKNIRLYKKIKIFFNFIKAVAGSIIDFFKNFFKIIIGTSALNQNYDKAGKKIKLSDFRNLQKISNKKKKEINSIIKSFILLIKWGEKKGVKYYRSSAPKEYINSLYKYLSRSDNIIEKNLNEIADIFEEVLFSDHIIGNEVIRNYKLLIRKTIKENK